MLVAILTKQVSHQVRAYPHHPGTPMEEIFQLAGCTADGERVHDRQDLQKMYNAFMRNLEVKYGKLLQEVFLEHPELFVLEERVSDVDALRASQERIKEIHEALKVCVCLWCVCVWVCGCLYGCVWVCLCACK